MAAGCCHGGPDSCLEQPMVWVCWCSKEKEAAGEIEVFSGVTKDSKQWCSAVDEDGESSGPCWISANQSLAELEARPD